MILRLLYRLLLQHLGRKPGRHTAGRDLSTAIPPDATTTGASIFAPSGSNAKPRRVSFTRIGLPVALLIVVGVIVYRVLPDSLMPDSLTPAGPTATLQLSIGSSSNWPLVVYLSGDRLNLPEFDDAAIRSQKIESVSGMFSPTFQLVSPGSQINIVNSDPIAHNTHVFNRGGTLFNVATPTAGTTVQKTLSSTGVLSVRCDLHPAMQAWLFAPPTPHYAVVRQPQTVEFSEIPAGDYVLHYWHPDSNEHLRQVNLKEGENRTLTLK